MQQHNSDHEVQQRLDEFRRTRIFCTLSTLNEDGSPHASYAPCLIMDDAIAVFVSQLSAHCRNILRNPRVGVLLLGDESQIRNPFARQRLNYQCLAQAIPTSEAAYLTTLQALEALHGPTVALLQQLPDFILFALKPQRGTYIEGFGQAYTLSGSKMRDIAHIDAQQIQSQS